MVMALISALSYLAGLTMIRNKLVSFDRNNPHARMPGVIYDDPIDEPKEEKEIEQEIIPVRLEQNAHIIIPVRQTASDYKGTENAW